MEEEKTQTGNLEGEVQLEEEIQEERVENEPVKSKKTGLKPLQMFIAGIVGFLVLIVVAIAIYGVMGTKKVSDSPFVLKVAKVLNLSATKVNGDGISYLDYMDDLKTLNKFYESQPDFPKPSEEEISDQVISRLVANSIIAKIAQEYNVEVTQEELDEAKTGLMSQFSTQEEIEDQLQSRYGWTLDTYIQKVMKPVILEQNLQKAFTEMDTDADSEFTEEQVRASHILFQFDPNTSHEDTKTLAEEVLRQIKDGADFAEMAAQYGSDGTKDVGGDLGWFARGVMVPEFEDAVFALKPGELGNELVETTFGYHIVKVVEKKNVRNFVDFMDNEIKNAKVKILIDIHNPFESLLDDTEVIDDTGDTEDLADVEVIDDSGDGGEAELAE
ncbi:MAG: peptidylprolyl isomerase [Candidatus Magasanikbacteria bacterium]